MYGHDAIVHRISILAVTLLAVGAIACGRTPAASSTGGAEQGATIDNAVLTEFEHPGQRAVPQSLPLGTAGTEPSRPAFDPNGPNLIP